MVEGNGQGGGTRILQRDLVDRVKALEADHATLTRELAEHRLEVVETRAADADERAGDAKRNARWVFSLAFGLLATAFLGGGYWLALTSQVSDNERKLIVIEARQDDALQAVGVLGRNQKILGADTSFLVRQVQEQVDAEREGRPTRIVQRGVSRLETLPTPTNGNGND